MNLSVRILASLSLNLVLSAAAVAQNAPDYSIRQLEQQSAMTHELILREAYSLSSSQVQRISAQLRKIREIVRNEDNQDSGGGSYPQPQPARRVLIKGTIENNEFSFEVEDLLSLQESCVAFVTQKNLMTVDDIQVSINFGPIETLKNKVTYWKGANQVCNPIVRVAKAKGLNLSRSRQNLLIGNMEGRDFTFKGFSRMDVNRQCEDFLNQNHLTSVDDIIVSTNFGEEVVLKNNVTYWKNSLEICSQILQFMPR